MSKWETLNRELDDALENMSSEDWNNWMTKNVTERCYRNAEQIKNALGIDGAIEEVDMLRENYELLCVKGRQEYNCRCMEGYNNVYYLLIKWKKENV